MKWFRNLVDKFSEKTSEKTSEESSEKNLEKNLEKARPIDAEFLLELEETLLRKDCGIEFAEQVVQKIKGQKISAEQAVQRIKEFALKLLQENQANLKVPNKKKLETILIVGVNGAGKTTSIGKLAHRFKEKEQKKVLIAPCDTFRAAAEEQAKIWSERAGATIYSSTKVKQRPDALLYESLLHAQKENFEILLVDTAGRLQNKEELMNELAKIERVLAKHSSAEENNLEKFLILDANTGQNALQQVKLFHAQVNLTGIVLTKLDSTAKGGVILAIANELKIPFRYVGTGEKIDDLAEFSAQKFIQSFFD